MILKQEEKASFTDLALATGVDTGKLSFHLRSLVDFLDQTPEGKYTLGIRGKNAIVLIKDLEDWAIASEISDKPVNQNVKPSRRITASILDFILIQLFMFLAFQLYLLASNLYSDRTKSTLYIFPYGNSGDRSIYTNLAN